MSKTAAHVVRRRSRRDANGAFGLGTTTPNYAWDFVNNKARFNNINYGALANTPGWSFTRASIGYAQTSAGVLVPFASGELRRTDKGVLIEGARTNLLLRSQEFDNASWVKTNATVTANTDVAPDGNTTADTITNVAATGDRATQNVVAGTTSSHVFSCFLKAGVGGITTLLLRNNTTATNIAAASFTLSGAGSAGSVTGTATITRLAGTSWYFCSIASSSGVTSGDTLICYVYAGVSSGIAGYTSIVWGAQLEAASFPSSYIPTTTASATRAADVLTVPVSGLDYPLTLYAEFERAVDAGGTEDLFQVYATNNNDRAKLYVGTNDRPSVLMTAGGVSQGSVSRVFSTVVATSYKLAGRFGTNTIQVAQGGSLGTEDTTATAPTAPNTISFGRSASGANPCFGYLRRAAIWNRALTDAELQSLTT